MEQTGHDAMQNTTKASVGFLWDAVELNGSCAMHARGAHRIWVLQGCVSAAHPSCQAEDYGQSDAQHNAEIGAQVELGHPWWRYLLRKGIQFRETMVKGFRQSETHNCAIERITRAHCNMNQRNNSPLKAESIFSLWGEAPRMIPTWAIRAATLAALE